MQLQYNYWWFKNALPKLLCRDIINFAKSKNDTKFAIVAGVPGVEKETEKLSKRQKQETKKVRNSNVVWLREPWIINKIIPYVRTANENAGWNFEFENCESIQFTIYGKNQHYDWHADCGVIPDENGKVRKLSASILLNEPSEFEGGELEFGHYSKPNQKPIILSSKENLTSAGSMAVFPSFVFHRVKPVTKGVRYSLVVWLQGSPLK
jgi:PKHD-type hydroxylase